MSNIAKFLIYFIFQQMKYQTKRKIENNEYINWEHYKTLATIITIKKNSQRRFLYKILLFVLQLLWFKSYLHTEYVLSYFKND
jgi:hypothetical protein